MHAMCVCVFGCARVCACIGVFFSFCSEICHPGMLYCHVRKGYPTRMTFEYTTSMRNPPLFSHEWCSHRRDVAIVEIVSNCLLEASKRFEHKQNVMHTDLSNCLSLIFCLTSNCLCLKQLLASNCYFLCIRPIVVVNSFVLVDTIMPFRT